MKSGYKLLYLQSNIEYLMAKIKFNVNSKKNPANLNLRFYHGKNIDCNALTHILIDPKIWSNKMQSLKPNVDKNIKQYYNKKLNALKNYIIFSFNDSFSSGKKINSNWLNQSIKSFYNRPEINNDNLFVLYVEKYIEKSKNRINQKSGKPVSNKTITKYNNVKNKIIDFETHLDYQFIINEIDLNFHNKFVDYLSNSKNYSSSFIQRTLRQIKSFIREAKIDGFKISDEIESKRFSYHSEETIDTYLNEKEISKIFKFDFSDNERLDNVRDLFIIGLRTGLRISDLKRIEDFQFTKNTILIANTVKTGIKVEIPIHPQIKKTINKRNGELPKVISDQKFNEYVKEVCKEVGLTQKILGKLKNPETNRKEKGYFKKYKLISSHTCRRSFATNLYGKIDDKTIMAITGHKSHKQFMSYIKTTQKEHIEKLAKFWKENN